MVEGKTIKENSRRMFLNLGVRMDFVNENREETTWEKMMNYTKLKISVQ